MKKIIEKIFNNTDSFVSKFTFSVVLAIAAFFGGSFFLTGGFFPELLAPFNYSGDSLSMLDIIKRVTEENWYFFTDKMGFPFGSVMYSYPIPDFGSLAILKIIGKITGSYVAAHNLYFLLGFSFTAVATYLILLKMKLNNYLCVVGALLFDFVPFHIMRLGHLFYTWYFVVPIFFYYCFKIFSNKPPFFTNTATKKTNIIDLVILLILSSFGIYYVFFGVMLMAISGFVSLMYNKNKNNLFSALLAITITFSGILIITAPNIYHQFMHGENTEAVSRAPLESEWYGLKITQLLMPRQGHRLKLFSEVTTKYNSSAPLINENTTSSLGMIGSFGFIFLLIVLLLAPFTKSDDKKSKIITLLIDDRLKILSLLTITMVLFMTIGGFSSLFAQFVTPNLRGWNRVSIFIAFASITAFLITCNFLIEELHKNIKNKYLIIFCSSILLAFGLWDQTSLVPANANWMKVVFSQDEDFVQKIDNFLPKNSAVFQFPYVKFPEAPPICALGDYALSVGYLHSKTLKWSYGALKGSEGDIFYQNLSEQSLEKQINIIKKLGFAGIYVDRRGYADKGVAFEKELQKVLKASFLFESENKLISFYKLSNIATVDYSSMKPAKIMKDVGFVVDKLGARYDASLKDGIDFRRKEFPNFVQDIDGLSVIESWGRWTDSSELKIVFFDKLPKDFTLVLKTNAFGPNINQPIKVLVGHQEQKLLLDATIKEHRLSFNNTESNELILFIPKPTSPAELGMSQDSRKLGIGIEKLYIE